MTNPCNILDNRNFDSIRKECSRGIDDFERNLYKLVRYRHQIGAAMNGSPEDAPPGVLVGILKSSGAALGDSYRKMRGTCDKVNDYAACGYAQGYESYIKLFGLPGELKEKSGTPTEINFKPLATGYPILGISPQESGQEMFLDSGASASIFSPSYYSEAKKDFLLVGPGDGVTPIYAYSGDAFEIGAATFMPEIVGVGGPADKFEGSDIQHRLIATLGADFLFRQPIEINRDRSVVVINQDVRERLKEGGWFAAPIYPRVRVGGTGYDIGIITFINDVRTPMLLDTGASNTTLGGGDQCRSKFPKERSGAAVLMYGAGGVFTSEIIPNVRVGFGGKDVLLEKVFLAHANSYVSEASAGVGTCGSLGNDIFSLFNFVIDPVTMTLYSSPASADIMIKKWDIPPLDMGYSRIGNCWIIDDVAGGGRVQKAGIKAGDKLIKIDGQDLASFSFLQLEDLLYKLGNQAEIVFERDGKRSTVTIDLSEKDNVPKTPPPAAKEELVKPSKGCGAHLGARP